MPRSRMLGAAGQATRRTPRRCCPAGAASAKMPYIRQALFITRCDDVAELVWNR